MQFNKSSLTFSVLAIMASTAYAQTEVGLEQHADTQKLPTITVQAENNQQPYAAKTANAVLRSNTPLFETAQSISAIGQQQIEQKQAKTVAEALEGVAGVTSGQYGRRGWDDFIIRGQISSSQTFIDGLRIQASDNVLRAEDISGLESIEVVKGPTSVGFGLALPGGLVNLTTKRPQAETAYKGILSYGSYGLKEGTFDLNYAPNNSAKGAFRVVGRVSDQDDPTESYTAALNKPYSDRQHFNIDPITSQIKLNELVKNTNEVGFPVAIHAIGDKSVDIALNAIESTSKHLQMANRIEHIEVISKVATSRFAELGVVASMQPDHAIAGNYQESRLGADRLPYSYAWKTLLSYGASMVLGSDWPTAPENPMIQLSDVIFREYNGKTRYSDDALSLDEALYAYTQAPANIAGWGNEIGSISVGKWADFLILQDTLKLPLNKNIRDWKVIQTWFAGQKVFDRQLKLNNTEK